MKKILFATVAVIAFSTSVAMALPPYDAIIKDLSNKTVNPVNMFHTNLSKLTELKTNVNIINSKLQETQALLQRLQADLATTSAAIPVVAAATQASKAQAVATLRQAASDAINNANSLAPKCPGMGALVAGMCFVDVQNLKKVAAEHSVKAVAIENTAIPQ